MNIINNIIKMQIKALIIICIFTSITGGFIIPYVVNTWLIYCGKTVLMKWWQGALIGLFPPATMVGFVISIITYILMFFLI